MPSVDPAIHAMSAINHELPIHFGHLNDPETQGSARDQIGRNAAKGVAHGLFAVAIHQQLLAWTLDDLETAEALAGEALAAEG